MNKKSFLALAALSSIALTSCKSTIDYKENLNEYVRAMQFHNKFNIVQLTDIHWNYNTSTSNSKVYLDKLLKQVDKHIKNEQGETAKMDLVELTGDLFMLANTYHVSTFISFIEEKAEQYGFKYAVIWGNHDRHGLYNPNWLSEQFRKAKNAIYVEPEDNLYGRSNFVINLTDTGEKEGATKWQIVNLDSGASFSETAISPFRDYDYIREDQTDWFIKEHEKVGESVPAIAYYHIPQQDNLKAYESREGRKHKFFKLEDFDDNGKEQYASNFIEEGRKHNLKAAFMGHAHNVDWTVDYDGVTIGLGVKTGAELYFAHIDAKNPTPEMKEGLESVDINENFDLIGASLVTINDESSFDLEHVYYNERANEDFVKWVKY